MNKYSGKKIKKRKKIYARNRNKNTVVTLVISIIVIAVFVFLGYSVGKPIIEYFQNKDNINISETLPLEPETSEVGVTTTIEDEVKLTTMDEGALSEGYSALYITSDSLMSLETLRVKLEAVRSLGYSAVVVDLKAEGGNLNYKSQLPLVQNTNVCISDISASEIATIISEYHMKPIARINTLTDHLIPKVDRYMGYRFENENSAWYDNKVEKGGKPWLSPFAPKTIQYLADVAGEVSDAGFETIIICDLEFFPFRKNDFTYIGEIIQSEDRYKALLNVADAMQNAIGNTINLEVSAKSIIDGTCEAFKPTETPEIIYLVTYNSSEFKSTVKIAGEEKAIREMAESEKAVLVLNEVKSKANGREIIPCIESESLNDTSIKDIISALVEAGYDSYVLK